MAITAKQFIEGIYVAYWGRAADPGGLYYWLGQFDDGTLSLAGIAENFAAQPEATAEYAYFNAYELGYPISDSMIQTFVEAIYQNLFDRAPDAAGLAYWTDILKTGASSPGAFIANILNSAYEEREGDSADDWASVWAKIEVAEYYTDQIVEQNVDWTVEGNLQQATDVLDGITKDTDIAAEKASIDNLLDDVQVDPVFAADTYTFSVLEDRVEGYQVGQIAATDVDGDHLTYAISSGNESGYFAIDAGTGKITLTAAASGHLNFEGTASYTLGLRVTDGAGGQDTATATVNLTNANEAPVFQDSTPYAFSVRANASEGTALGTTTAVDPDAGDTLAYSITAGNDDGYFAIDAATGAITLAAAGVGNIAADTVYNLTVAATDAAGLTDQTATKVTISSAVNNAPTLTADALTLNEDPAAAVAGTLVGADIDNGDTLTYSVDTTGTTGTVTLGTDGAYTYKPTANFNGTDSFVATVTDAGGLSASQTIDITVNPVGDAPTTSAQTVTGGQGLSVIGTYNAADVDGDALTFAITAQPLNGAVVDNGDGTFTFTPANALFYGNDRFSYSVSDGSTSATQSVTIDVNARPVVSDVAVVGNEDSAVINGSFVGTDVEGAALTYSIVSTPDATAGTLTNNGDGTFSFAPAADFNGNVTFNYTASDGISSSTEGVVTVSVAAVNDAPTLTADPLTLDEDPAAPVAGTVVGADIDAGDTLAYSVDTTGTNGTVTIDAATGAYTYMPTADFNGSDSFVATVTDLGGLSASQTVNITVNATNDAPTLTADPLVLDEDAASAAGTLVGADINGDAITYSIDTTGTNGTVTLGENGAYTYVPTANSNGTDSFVATVTDAGGLSASQTVDITVNPVNDAPTLTAEALTLDEDPAAAVAGTLVGADIDNGDTLTYSINTAGTTGTVILGEDGAYTYKPTANFNGTDSFVATVTDEGGLTASQTVDIIVTAVNDAPTTASQTVTSGQGIAATGTYSASDVEADALTYTISAQPLNGAVVDKGDGTFTFTPDPLFYGKDQFTYSVSDGKASATQTVSVKVDAAPLSNDVTVTANEDAAVINGSFDGTDVEGSALTYAVVTAPDAAAGTFTDKGDGTFTFVPTANYNGDVTFTYTASDGISTSNEGTVTIEIAAVNDPPAVTDQALDVIAGGSTSGAVTSTDVDTDAALNHPVTDSVTYTADTTGIVTGTLTLDAAFATNGKFSYNPNTLVAGSTETFTVTVTDEAGANTDSDVTFTVTNPDSLSGDAVDDTATAITSQATTVNVLANDNLTLDGGVYKDADGHTVTITGVTQPSAGGTVTFTDTNVTFTSSPGYTGSSKFTYTINDGFGGSDVGAVVMTVDTNLGGTAGNDLINGSTLPEVITGLGGTDTIDGGGGADQIDAGADNDRVTANGAETNIIGNTGTDTLVLGPTTATIQAFDVLGGTGDFMIGPSGNVGNHDATGNQNQSDLDSDFNYGELSNQDGPLVLSFENLDGSGSSLNLFMRSSANTTSILTGSGNDTVEAAQATTSASINTGGGTDAIYLDDTVWNNMTVAGGTGTDTVTTDQVTFTDAMFANYSGIEGLTTTQIGATSITIGTNASAMIGTSAFTVNTTAAVGGNVSMDASLLTGNVFITAGRDDNDAANDATGNDTLTGGSGNDTLHGGGALDANDSTSNGGGADKLVGNAGNDVFTFGDDADWTVGDTITGGDGTDAISLLSEASATGVTTADADWTAVTGVEVLNLFSDVATTYGQTIVIDALWAAAASDGFVINGSGAKGVVTLDADDTVTAIDNYSIQTGAGDDVFQVGSARFDGSDSYAGGTGTDEFEFAAQATIVDADFAAVTGVERLDMNVGANSVTLGTNASTSAGSSTFIVDVVVDGSNQTVAAGTMTANMSITSGTGNDSMVSGSGNDTITSTTGADSIGGGAGNDIFQFLTASLTAGDTISGGDGQDIIAITEPVNLADAVWTKVTGVEQLNMFAGGGAQALVIDTIWAAAASDGFKINGAGATAAVTLDADDNTSAIDNYSIITGSGDDVFQVGSARFDGNDTYAAGTGTDEFEFAAQATIVDADFTAVTGVERIDLNAAATANSVTIGAFASTSAGTATFIVDATGSTTGPQTVNASAMTVNVSIAASSGGDSLTGGSGNDTISGSGGADKLVGNAGNDTFTFAQGDDLTAGDTITGGDGTDKVEFTADCGGASSLADADFQFVTGIEKLEFDHAGGTAQLLTLGLTNANTNIGAGNNWIIDETAGTGSFTLDASGLTTAAIYYQGGTGTGTASGGGAADTLDGGAGADLLTGNAGNDSINGAAGDDQLNGSAGTDTITGLAGADAIDGGTDADNLSGGEGDDRVVVDNSGDVADGGDGTDTLVVSYTGILGGAVIDLSVTSGSDQMTSWNGSANAALQINFEHVDASGYTNFPVQITGSTANNVLLGGTAADVISAGAGTDTVTGGQGADQLTGGDGVDDFVYNHATGTDSITDFVKGAAGDEIQLDLSSLEAAGGSGLAGTATDFAGLSNGTSTAALASTITELAGGTAAAAEQTVYVVINTTFASTDLLETALETGTREITGANAAVAVGDAFLVVYSDGTNGYVAGVRVVADSAGDFVANDLVATNLIQLQGVTSIATGDFNLANFEFIA